MSCTITQGDTKTKFSVQVMDCLTNPLTNRKSAITADLTQATGLTLIFQAPEATPLSIEAFKEGDGSTGIVWTELPAEVTVTAGEALYQVEITSIGGTWRTKQQSVTIEPSL